MLFFLMNWKCWRERKSLHKNTLVCFILELVCFIHDRYIKFNISLKFQSRHLFFLFLFKWYHKLRYIMQEKKKASSITSYIRLYTFTSHILRLSFFSLSLIPSFLTYSYSCCIHWVSKKKVKKEVGCSSTRE